MSRAPMDCMLPRCKYLRTDIPHGELHDFCQRGLLPNGCCDQHSQYEHAAERRQPKRYYQSDAYD